MRRLLLAAAFTLAVWPAVAQSPVEKDVLVRPPERVLRMVDDLKRLTEGAERNQLASGRFLFDLRGLAKLYDWPWRSRFLADDFADGDYTRNPVWTASGGPFTVDARGLTSNGGGAIGTAKRMPNALALTVTLKAGDKGGKLGIALGQGEAKNAGYRLDVGAGQFQLHRLTGQGAQAIAKEGFPVDLADGQEHVLIWTRDADGRMQVGIDGKRHLVAQERSNLDPFDHLTVHSEGVWVLRSLLAEGM